MFYNFFRRPRADHIMMLGDLLVDIDCYNHCIEREDEIELVFNPFDNWYINRIFSYQIYMYLIAIKISSVFFSANSSIHTVAFFTYT